jgi:DNA primase
MVNKARASNIARKLVKIASPINWNMRRDLLEPNVFRMPTSLARLSDLAVDRFMKLITAKSKMNTATAENIYV